MRALLAIAVALILMAGCARLDATHNAAGGYIPACGDLPGMLGDDC